MPHALNPIIYVVAFISVVILVQTAAGLLFKASDQHMRINRRLTMLGAGLTPEQVYSTLMRRRPNTKAGSPSVQAFLSRLELPLAQAGLEMTPVRLLLITGGVAAALWLVALSLASSGRGTNVLANSGMSLIGAIVLAIIGVGLWVRAKRAARIQKIDEQLPLALDIVNRAVRAGHPVISAVRLASEELSDPIGSELGLVVDETNYGAEFREALLNMGRRTGSADVHFFAVSVSVQSETGGNLAEILQGLATVMRGRHTLGKRVKALASEGRASAVILSVLPVGVIAFQFLTHPTYYTDKFSDPIFWPVVITTLVFYGLGWVMINRIINFKY